MNPTRTVRADELLWVEDTENKGEREEERGVRKLKGHKCSTNYCLILGPEEMGAEREEIGVCGVNGNQSTGTRILEASLSNRLQ